MKYVITNYLTERGNSYNLTLERDGKSVYILDFATVDGVISDVSGIARLHADKLRLRDSTYNLYPIEEDVTQGQFEYLQIYPEYMIIKITSGKLISGIWVVRVLADNNVLFWKPPTLNEKQTIVGYSGDYKGEKKHVSQEYSLFTVDSGGKTFSGIAIAEGVWMGLDKRPTYFGKKIITNIGQQFAKALNTIPVFENHDRIPHGMITGVVTKEIKGINTVTISGTFDKPVLPDCALSLDVKSDLIWDNKINAYDLLAVEVEGLSVLTQGKPACTICMVD